MTSQESIHVKTDTIRRQIIKETGSFPGTCEYSKTLARSLGGWVYILETPSEHGLDHKITVSRIEDTHEGLIIDVTRNKNPYMGKVTDVFNFEQTAQEIGVIYGLPGWRMMLNYYG